MASDKFNKLFSEAPQTDIESFDEGTKWLDFSHHSMSFCVAVRSVLKAKGLSQKQLAASLSVSEQVVSKWLSGSENLTLETIANIERVLGQRLLYAGNSVSVLKMIEHEQVVLAEAVFTTKDVQQSQIAGTKVEISDDSFAA
jgi:transcriptional regulator with XRE-family HTH domain